MQLFLKSKVKGRGKVTFILVYSRVFTTMVEVFTTKAQKLAWHFSTGLEGLNCQKVVSQSDTMLILWPTIDLLAI